MDKEQGIYRTSLQSEMGCNLLVDINLERPANKLPVTINTISRLKSEVASLNTDLENVKVETMQLKAIDSLEKFVNFQLKSAESNRDRIKAMKLDEEIRVQVYNQEVSFTIRQLLSSLYATCKILKEKKIWKEGFVTDSPAATKSLEYFIDVYESAENARKKCFENTAASTFVKECNDSVPPFATAKRSIDHATEPPSFYDAIVPKNLEAVWGKLGKEIWRRKDDASTSFTILVTMLFMTIFGSSLAAVLAVFVFSKFITQLSVQVSRDKRCIMKFVRRTCEWAQVQSGSIPGRMFNGLSRALDKSLERVFPNSPPSIAVKTSLLGTLVLTFLPMLLKMFVGGG